MAAAERLRAVQSLSVTTSKRLATQREIAGLLRHPAMVLRGLVA
jgi:hypothetical protein